MYISQYVRTTLLASLLAYTSAEIEVGPGETVTVVAAKTDNVDGETPIMDQVTEEITNAVNDMISPTTSSSEDGETEEYIETEDFKTSDDICLADCSSGVCTFTFTYNHYASELGYYTVEECNKGGEEIVMPTLGIQKGVTYHFVQSNLHNWYHPLGFAYYPDGEHDDQIELEPGQQPPTSSSDCEESMTCPAPMYFLNGNYLGSYSNNADLVPVTTGEEDFGLDNYEPDFFIPVETWYENGDYSVYLKYDDMEMSQDIFYFCHIHQYVSGRIKFVDDAGKPLYPENTPDMPYEYESPSSYDKTCGTYGLSEFQLPHEECAPKYVCDRPLENPILHKYGGCIDSMNCAMQVGMSTYAAEEDPIALFNHMMIPHHQNAVNMAKSLYKTGEIDCADEDIAEETDDCTMYRIIMDIMNGQNKQIQLMQDVLEDKGYELIANCDVKIDSTLAATASAYSMKVGGIIGVTLLAVLSLLSI